MAHAETCPVCRGSGCTDDGKEPRITVDCHGCNGKGWVEIGSSDPIAVPMQPWPVYAPPRWLYQPQVTIGPWVYESGTYSANVEVVIT